MSGIIYAVYPGATNSVESMSGIIKTLQSRVIEADGNLTVRRCPTAWKKDLPVWGRPGPDRELMRHVKRTLDPQNVFNPGRLYPGL